jgi:hypothetical protein
MRTEQSEVLPLVLTLDSALAEGIRDVFDILPECISLFFCIIILWHVIQWSEDDDAVFLEMQETKRDLGVAFARSSARAAQEVSSASSWIQPQ